MDRATRLRLITALKAGGFTKLLGPPIEGIKDNLRAVNENVLVIDGDPEGVAMEVLLTVRFVRGRLMGRRLILSRRGDGCEPRGHHQKCGARRDPSQLQTCSSSSAPPRTL